MKQFDMKRFIESLRYYAKVMELPYEDRDDEFEEQVVAYVLNRAAELLEEKSNGPA
jgi:hypothetical protein